jgi:hypothetical protein
VGSAKVKFVINRKPLDRAIPREAGWAIDAEKIAAIPVDPSLIDASDFRVDLADGATLAEYTKIAEFCIGRTLIQKRSGFRRFWLESWLRGSSRSPELYTTAAR